MKISWNDVDRIFRYLNNELTKEEKILCEAQLILNPDFKFNVGLLKRIHSVIRLHGRKKMKIEIGKIHDKLFQNREHVIFQQRIQQLFEDN